MNNTTSQNKMIKPTINFKWTSTLIRWFREILAIFLWITLFVQTFIFDFIGQLSQVLQIPNWFITYRSLILLAAVILIWLAIGNARFIRFGGYIACYPLVIIFWHLPRLCFKQWSIIAALLPAIISFMKSFRYSVATYGLSLISAFIIHLVRDRQALILAMLIIGCMLVIHYFRKMKTVFALKTAFAAISDTLNVMWENVKTSNAFVPPSDIDPTTKEGRSKFGSSLINMYLFTAVLSKIARQMKTGAESKILDLLLLLSWCFTLCFTITVFAFIFLGLEKAYPGSFLNATGFMSFLGYSLCILTTSDLTKIQPLSDTATIVSFLELGGSILVLILMAFLILTTLRDRFRDDFQRVTDELETTAKQFETLLTNNYKLTIHAAEEWLLSYSRETARYLLLLRHDESEIAAIEFSIGEKKKEDNEKS